MCGAGGEQEVRSAGVVTAETGRRMRTAAGAAAAVIQCGEVGHGIGDGLLVEGFDSRTPVGRHNDAQTKQIGIRDRPLNPGIADCDRPG